MRRPARAAEGGEELRLSGPRIAAEPAGADRLAQLQACLEGSADYLLRAEGRRPTPAAAAERIAEAEGDPQRRLLLISDRRSGEPLGLLDLLLDYPEPGVCHLVLLLLREGHRGRGLGRECCALLEEALRARGHSSLRLSVVEENGAARAFWERMGFFPVGRLERGVSVYEKALRETGGAVRRPRRPRGPRGSAASR